MKKMKCAITLALAAVTALSAAGCGGKPKVQSGLNELSGNTGPISYPIETDQELTYWVTLNATVSATAATLNDTPFAKQLNEETGINVKYIHPTQGQEAESFNLLIASGNVPDIIAWSWYGFAGGPDKAIEDKHIIRLNEILDGYAPNLRSILDANPQVDKMVKTDKGNYYNFPVLKLDDKLTVFYGPVVRKDWLDELGLSEPETIDDWHTVLTAFKEQKGASAPFSAVNLLNGIKNNGAFVGAFGTIANYYVDNGQIKYGPLDDPEFKEFLTVFHQWYEEGLIDQNISTIDNNALDAKILNGDTGATICFNSSGLGKWLTAKKDDPSFNLVAVKYPSLKAGERSEFGQKDLPYNISSFNAAISAKSQNQELAARFLDYGYSPEGQMLFNFGIEGESYVMENGEPKYTDLIMNNPDGLPIANALGKYAHSSYEGPFSADVRYFDQYLPFEQQKEALEKWPDTNMAAHLVPRITPTEEESDEMQKIESDMNAYVDEMLLKFIMGTEPLSNYDQFIATIKEMGVERAKEIKQQALERYETR